MAHKKELQIGGRTLSLETGAVARQANGAMTLNAAARYARDRVRFNLIAPALIETPMAGRAVGDPAIRAYLAAKQPMSEDQLLTGELESTNQWYAVAKIAGLKLCEAYRRQYGDDFISVLPTNLYGPGDNYHPEHAHVVAALIRRFHEAKAANASSVTVWGTGTPRREFLYVEDFADACIFLLKNYSAPQFVNIGCGKDVTIAEFAQLVADVVGFKGKIVYDHSKPDGTPLSKRFIFQRGLPCCVA